jgi:hypothetical protein
MVFISYSHADRRYFERLRVHLRPLERDLDVSIWDDTKIQPGTPWRDEIQTALASADAAILLVSADFLASDFIANNELPPILRAQAVRGLCVLPVILSPCRFTETPALREFQAVNDPAKPITALPYSEKEAVWTKLARSVAAIAAGRKASDGWAVANERLVLAGLEELIQRRIDKSFLIIESGDYFYQFQYYPSKEVIYCEAVSNEYLPETAALSQCASDELIALGFKPPTEKAGFNYQRVYYIGRGRTQLKELAETAVRVFQDIYKVSQRAEVTTKFGAEDDNWPA